MHGEQGRRALILGGLFLFSSTGIADSIDGDFDDLMNRPPWASCTYCHGETGNIDDPNVPALAGQSETYLRKQIADFRAKRRIDPSGMMTSALFLLDPDNDAQVAEFFAEQAAAPLNPGWSKQSGAASDPEASLFWTGKGSVPPCASCHVNGDFGAPKLEGLSTKYVERQLRRFQSEQRTNDVNGVMRSIASELNDEDIVEILNSTSSKDHRK